MANDVIDCMVVVKSDTIIVARVSVSRPSRKELLANSNDALVAEPKQEVLD